MRRSLLLATFLLGSLTLLTNCHKEAAEPTYTHEGYIIGFDPCRAGEKALLIALTAPQDTVNTFNFPAGLYPFTPAMFAAYRSNYLFPDSVRTTYKVRITYRLTPPTEKELVLCQGDIWLAPFQALRSKEVIIISAQKD